MGRLKKLLDKRENGEIEVTLGTDSIESIQKDFNSLSGSGYDEDKYNSLSKRANAARAYVNANKSKLSEQNRHSLMSYMTGINNGLKSSTDNYKKMVEEQKKAVNRANYVSAGRERRLSNSDENADKWKSYQASKKYGASNLQSLINAKSKLSDIVTDKKSKKIDTGADERELDIIDTAVKQKAAMAFYGKTYRDLQLMKEDNQKKIANNDPKSSYYKQMNDLIDSYTSLNKDVVDTMTTAEVQNKNIKTAEDYIPASDRADYEWLKKFNSSAYKRQHQSDANWSEQKEKAEKLTEHFNDLKEKNKASSIAYYDQNNEAVSWDKLYRIKATEQDKKSIYNSKDALKAYNANTELSKDVEYINDALMDLTNDKLAETDFNAAEQSNENRKLIYLANKYGITTSKRTAGKDLVNSLDPFNTGIQNNGGYVTDDKNGMKFVTTAQDMDEVAEQLRNVKKDLESKISSNAETMSANGYSWENLKAYDDYMVDQRRYGYEKRKAEQYAKEHPVLASAETVIASPIKVYELGKNIAESIQNSGADETSMAGLPNYYNDTVSNRIDNFSASLEQNISDSINEKYNSPVAAWLLSKGFSGAMSGLQSGITTTACLGLFGPAGEYVSLAVMGSEAAQSAYKRAAQNGESNGKALLTAAVEGINEALFERISIEKWMDIKGSMDISSFKGLVRSTLGNSRFWKDLAKQGLTEGSEEVFTDLANTMADFALNTNNTDFNRKIEQYEAQGMSREEAIQQYQKEFSEQLLESFYGGAIGGLTGAGGKYMLNTALTSVNSLDNMRQQFQLDKATGKLIAETGSADTVLNQMKNTVDKDSKTAVKIDELMSADTENMSEKELEKHNRKVAKIANRIVNEQSDLTDFELNRRNAVKSAVEAELKSNKVIRDEYKTELATNAIYKSLYSADEELSPEEAKVLEKPKMQAVLSAVKEQKDSINEDAIAVTKKAVDTLMRVQSSKYGVDLDDLSEYEYEPLDVSGTNETILKQTGDNERYIKVDDNVITSTTFTDKNNNDITLGTKENPVSINDLSIGNANKAIVLESLRSIQNDLGTAIDVDTANYIYKIAQSHQDPGRFMIGATAALATGYFGHTVNTSNNVLESTVKEELIRRGEALRESSTYQKQNMLNLEKAEKGAKKSGHVTFEKGADENLTDDQKNQITYLEAIAKGTKADFVVYKSEKGSNKPNGYYANGVIHVDINAGNNFEGTMLWTAAHELTHYMREYSPEDFNKYADFLISNYEKQGNFEALVRLKQNEKDANGNTLNLTYDQAYEECLADAAMEFLNDKNVAEKLVNEDKTFIDKLLDALKKLYAFLANVGKNVGSLKTEAQIVRTMSEDVQDKIKDIWSTGLKNASKNVTEQDIKNYNEDKFSLRAPIEETKNLLAVHNLQPSEILSSIELGGMPAPSTAIVKAEHGHTKYGECSFIFDKETIDPKLSKYNYVFSHDAWTPVFPSVEYKVNNDKVNELARKLQKIIAKSGINASASGDLLLDYSNTEDQINRWGNVVDAYASKPYYKLAYLIDIGSDIDVPAKEVSLSSMFMNEEIANVAKALGADNVHKMLQMENKSTTEPSIEKVKEVLKNSIDNRGLSEFDKQMFNTLLNEDFDYYTFRKVLNAARQYINNSSTVPKEINKRELEKLVNAKVQDDDQNYLKWLNSIFDGIIEKKGIRNNTDVFTPSGSRRSWEALHYAVTLENVLKKMRQDNPIGSAFGGNTIYATAAKQYKSINDIKKDSYRLEEMEKEYYDDQLKVYTDEFQSIAESAVKEEHRNSFVDIMDMETFLNDAIQKRSTVKGLDNYLKKELAGWGQYYPELASDLMKVVEGIRSLPTKYLEAKPMRAIGFDEVKLAVIPDNIDSRITDFFNENGVPYIQYEKGNDQQRIEIMNSEATDHLKFSMRTPVEEKRNLLAVHNLKVDDMVGSIELGGFPVPSIAVVKADQGHTKYGDYSVIFGKESIDPLLSDKNYLFTHDAYTPTFPSVEYKINSKKVSALADKLIGILARKGVKAEKTSDLLLDNYNTEEKINNAGSVINAFANKPYYKLAYLLDSGINVEIPKTEVKLARYYDNDEIEYLVNHLGTEKAEELKNIYYNDESDSPKYVNAQETVRKILYNNKIETHEARLKELESKGGPKYRINMLKRVFNDKYSVDEFSIKGFSNVMEGVAEYLDSGNTVRKIVDRYALEDTVNELLEDNDAKYNLWLNDMFNGVVEGKGIPNDKSYLTNSGNRRSWEALHYAYNLENIVRRMSEEDPQGLTVLGKSLYGSAAGRYKSIDEARADQGRLQEISEEEFNDLVRRCNRSFDELARTASKSNDFESLQNVEETFCEAVIRRSTVTGVDNYLKKELKGWANYNPNLASDLMNIVADIRSLPTKYFEAKPMRAVGFDEVKLAIIPDNADTRITEYFDKNNVPYVKYEAGNDQQRIDIMNSEATDDIKFSRRTKAGPGQMTLAGFNESNDTTTGTQMSLFDDDPFTWKPENTPKPSPEDVYRSTLTIVERSDERIYAPKSELPSKADWYAAIKSGKSKDTIEARKKILSAAHDVDITKLLGISDEQYKKFLTNEIGASERAQKIMKKVNENANARNAWAGIQNLLINKMSPVGAEDLNKYFDLKKESDSLPDDYTVNLLISPTLALDTHISWNTLSVDFKAGPYGRSARFGDYSSTNHEINIYSKDTDLGTAKRGNTVSHEMGHALDRIMLLDAVSERYIDDLRRMFGNDSIKDKSSFLNDSKETKMSRAYDHVHRYSRYARYNEADWYLSHIGKDLQERYIDPVYWPFVDDLRKFIKDVKKMNKAYVEENGKYWRNSYKKYFLTNTEIFARFTALFVEWAQDLAGTGYEYTVDQLKEKDKMYSDVGYTDDHYLRFVNLLQLKAEADSQIYDKGETDFKHSMRTYGSNLGLKDKLTKINTLSKTDKELIKESFKSVDEEDDDDDLFGGGDEYTGTQQKINTARFQDLAKYLNESKSIPLAESKIRNILLKYKSEYGEQLQNIDELVDAFTEAITDVNKNRSWMEWKEAVNDAVSDAFYNVVYVDDYNFEGSSVKDIRRFIKDHLKGTTKRNAKRIKITDADMKALENNDLSLSKLKKTYSKFGFTAVTEDTANKNGVKIASDDLLETLMREYPSEFSQYKYSEDSYGNPMADPDTAVVDLYKALNGYEGHTMDAETYWHDVRGYSSVQSAMNDFIAETFIDILLEKQSYDPYVALKAANKNLMQAEKQYGKQSEEYKKAKEEADRNASEVKSKERIIKGLNEKLNKQKEDYAKKLKEEIAKETEKIKKKVERQQKKKVKGLEEKIKKQKESEDRARLSKARTEFRNKIRRLIDKSSKALLSPTMKNYIPARHVKQLTDILKSFDIDTGRSEKLSAKLKELQVAYEAMGADAEVAVTVYDKNIVEMLMSTVSIVGDTKFMDMDVRQLRSIYQTLTSMAQVISNARSMVDSAIKKEAYEAARQWIGEIKSAPAKNTKASSWLDGMARPEYFFNMISGAHKNNMGLQLYQMLNEGQLHQTALKVKFYSRFTDLVQDKKLDDLKKKVTYELGFKDKNGNRVDITYGMLISLYLHLQNEKNTLHITGGGLQVPGLKSYYKGDFKKAYNSELVNTRPAYMHLDDDLREVEARIEAGDTREDTLKKRDELKDKIDNRAPLETEYGISLLMNVSAAIDDYDAKHDGYLKKWIKASRYFFDVDSKDAANETTMKKYGFKKAMEKNYFPINVDDAFLNQDFEFSIPGINLENINIMKSRTRSKLPLYLEDITNVLNRHIDAVSKYAGMMIPIDNFKKVYNVRGKDFSMQNTLRKFDARATGYIENLMKDLTAGRKDGESGPLDKLRHALAGAALTANLRVAMSQAASYVVAAAEIDYKSLAKALIKGGKSNKLISRADVELIQKWSPLLKYRSYGYATQELGDLKENGKKVDEILNKAKWLTGWINAFDLATVGRLWSAAEYYVQDTQKDLEVGTDDYYRQVAEVFNRVVENTQPNYTTLQRPDVLRNPKSTIRMLTMFMTQRLQNVNIIRDSYITYKAYEQDHKKGLYNTTQEDVVNAKKKFIRSITSQLISVATLVAMRVAYAFLMHSTSGYKDKETGEITAESFWTKVLDDFLSNVIGSVTFGSIAYDAIKAMVTGGTYYGISVNGIDSVESVIKSINNLVQAFTSNIGDVPHDLYALFKSLCQAVGLPAGNIETIIEGIGRWAEDIATGNVGKYESDFEIFPKPTNVSQKQITNGKLDEAKSSGNVKSTVDQLINDKVADGKTQKEAESSVQSSITAYCKEWYQQEGSDKKAILNFMADSGVYDDNVPKKKTLKEFINDNYLVKWAK